MLSHSVQTHLPLYSSGLHPDESGLSLEFVWESGMGMGGGVLTSLFHSLKAQMPLMTHRSGKHEGDVFTQLRIKEMRGNLTFHKAVGSGCLTFRG